jgi:hypothetical protein
MKVDNFLTGGWLRIAECEMFLFNNWPTSDSKVELDFKCREVHAKRIKVGQNKAKVNLESVGCYSRWNEHELFGRTIRISKAGPSVYRDDIFAPQTKISSLSLSSIKYNFCDKKLLRVTLGNSGDSIRVSWRNAIVILDIFLAGSKINRFTNCLGQIWIQGSYRPRVLSPMSLPSRILNLHWLSPKRVLTTFIFNDMPLSPILGDYFLSGHLRLETSPPSRWVELSQKVEKCRSFRLNDPRKNRNSLALSPTEYDYFLDNIL